ncbi:MAG TPA: DUF6010 family protein [Pyrinomonadaceae bacterium]
MQTLIEIVIGMFLAVGFILIVRRSRTYTREKRSLAIGLVVTALIYVGLGLFSSSLGWILTELAGVPIYAVFAWLGLRKSGWWLAAGWALHPLWDACLHDYSTHFVPHWYIGGCIGFDLLVAVYVGFREIRLSPASHSRRLPGIQT